MIGLPRLARLPRGGTLHVIGTEGIGAWPMLAMAAADASCPEPARRVIIGKSPDAGALQAMDCKIDAALAPIAGRASWLAPALRRWVVGQGVAPLMTVVWGESLAPMVQRALPHAERIVHAGPPSWGGEACERAARKYWRDSLPSDRQRQREALGISPEAFVVLATAESVSAVAASEAFAVVGRAAFAGSDVVLIAPEGSHGVATARAYARASKLSRALATVSGAERPSRLWLACDLVWIGGPRDASTNAWRSACAWWAIAAGIPVLSDGCAPDVPGVTQVAAGDTAGAARAILELAAARYAKIPVTT